ncbi:MAG: ABC transporter substrate-binding protein [Desulfomonilia bacterium]|jgi:branched-chain amino acid transport system substrate-binding protein|uniref:Leucine-binding protein domain-containing protein n=1 Tax=anaerobic digester metagenome TaxID=1263854 RepID=A0A485M005_9ZZZZ|nr:ABC transporter substrate-binding protein [Deltaproteobacteria bacterium]HPD21063.1 ABC transporter substrate-binding protein [Deltaproteobacteria bacterium]HRS55284.1 ABC transporter substrate-binding protein [Desulfomonilia bacterium]HRV35533.1 ABC transporter substrate-binding protein [Desulfomonilia bacterium]
MKGTRSMVFWLLALILVLMLPVQGHAGPPGFDKKEIRIAQWGPQTGPAAPWGSVARGSDLIFRIVNEEGGIHGRTIKYFIRDDQYNPAQTKAVVKELVERRGIFAFVGGVGAPCGMAVKDYLAENKVVWVGPSTAINEYVFPVNPYLFAIYPLYEDEASILTKYAVEKLKAQKIGFFYQNDSYGKSGLEGCKQRLNTYNMSLVEEVSVEPSEKDLSSQMLRLKNSGAEVVFLWVNPTSATIALKTSATIGFKPQWISSDTLSDFPLMNTITGGLWEGVITGGFCLPPDSDHSTIVKYREAAKKYAPEERFGTFYLAGMLFAEPLIDALQRVGPNLSTDAFLDALNSTKDFQGIGPKITWSPDVHQGTDSIQILQCGPGGSSILLQDWVSNDLATWKPK